MQKQWRYMRWGCGGGRLGYAYDDDHRMRSVTGPGGAPIVTNDYDANGRVVRQVGPDGAIHTLDERGRVIETTVTDPAGAVRRVRFEDGWWVRDTLAAGTPVEATASQTSWRARPRRNRASDPQTRAA